MGRGCKFSDFWNNWGMKVILDNIRSALNVGSIIRTCDALGIMEVYFCGITPDPKNPKVQKTSLGGEKNIEIHSGMQTLPVVLDLLNQGVEIVALELTEKALPITDIEVGDEVALVVGNEVSGVSSEVLEVTTAVAMIPMQGVKESLNVSVAFGIAAFELSARKKTCGR